MNNIIIEVPKISDISTMVSWGKSTKKLWASERGGWYSLETLKKWIENPKDDVLLVARFKQKIVGMIIVHNMRDWAYCSALYVDQEFRGKGIGKALMTKATELLKDNGITSLALLAPESNFIQGFYESFGFKKGFSFRWMDKKL